MTLPIVPGATGAQIVHPRTGEIVALADIDDATLAEIHEFVADALTQARDARALLEQELLRRIGRGRSITTGAHIAEKQVRREWDRHATWEALSALVAAGLLAAGDADDAMPERVERKPDGRRLNSLLAQVIGEDTIDDEDAAAAVQALARARATRTTVRVARVAVDATATEDRS